MRTSDKGVHFIAKEEAAVTVAYSDGKHMSWGVGHYDPTLKPGDEISLADALTLFGKDLASRDAEITKMLKVTVTQNEFDCLSSAYYNKGSKVRPVIELLNAGSRDDALALLLTINRNEKGEFKSGLADRRNREMHVFLRADYGDLSTIKVYRGNPQIVAPTSEPLPAV